MNILAGIVGGLILNVMPCVLPVLAFKIQGWVYQAESESIDRRTDALVFLAGCLVTFSVFAIVITVMRTSGQTIGWGMHMQNSGFVAFLVALLFAFGLNAVGVFELAFAVNDSGVPNEGLWASFSHGALITLVSTPCSAPVLGAATAAALAQDATWYDTTILFWSIGLGLSLPVLIVGFVPAASKLIPRPGNWMNTFQIFVGFTLFGSAVWLFGTLQRQVSVSSSNDFLWFLLCLSIGLWFIEQTRRSDAEGIMRPLRHLAVLGGLVVAGFSFLHLDPPEKTTAPTAEVDLAAATDSVENASGHIQWIPFTEKLKAAAAKRGQPVFVDYTADWCASCKTFEKTHLEIDSVIKKFAETRILTAKADLTNHSDELWAALAKLGRNGLPAYVIYMPDGTFDLLPEGAPVSLPERLDAAAKKFPSSGFKDG